MFLFSQSAIGPTIYSMGLTAKALVEVNPGGAVVYADNADTIRLCNRGRGPSRSYLTKMFELLEGTDINVRFLKSARSGLSGCSFDDVLESPRIRENQLIYTCLSKPHQFDEKRLLSTAIQMCGQATLLEDPVVSDIAEKEFALLSELVEEWDRKGRLLS